MKNIKQLLQKSSSFSGATSIDGKFSGTVNMEILTSEIFEYGKELSIGFADFALYYAIPRQGKWHIPLTGGKTVTTEDLFKLYLNEINK